MSLSPIGTYFPLQDRKKIIEQICHVDNLYYKRVRRRKNILSFYSDYILNDKNINFVIKPANSQILNN